MRKKYHLADGSSDIVYAESLSRLLQQEHFSFLTEYSSVLFVTSQSFYENYYDKFSAIFESDTLFNWYVCPSYNEIHSISNYERVVNYIEEMKLPVNTILVGAGNEMIHFLCSYLRATNFYLSHYLLLPTNMKGFINALKPIGSLVIANQRTISNLYALPEQIIYDTMLIELEGEDSWFSDFFELLKLSLFSSNELFQLLSQTSFKRYQPWTPYVELVIDSLEEGQVGIDVSLMAVTRSFYELTESHYMTLVEKEQVSFLLYFYWCLKKGNVDFNFNLLVKWLTKLLPSNLRLPPKMNTYELAESITNELARYDRVLGLYQLGISEKIDSPTMKEMYHVIESYREI